MLIRLRLILWFDDSLTIIGTYIISIRLKQIGYIENIKKKLTDYL